MTRELTELVQDLRRRNLSEIVRVVHAIIVMDAAHPSTPDGYPTSASGGGTGGAGTSELTSTERGADRRMGRTVDPVHLLARDAIRNLHVLKATLQNLENVPRRLQALQQPPSARDLGNDTWCAHARFLELPYDTTWDVYRRSDLGGLWPEARPASNWVWRFARDHKRLPEREEMIAHLQRTTVRVKAG